MIENDEPKMTSIKTFVRGSFLYSQDGFGYEEKAQKEAPAESVQKIVEDKIGIADLKKEIAQKKRQIRMKKLSKNDKPPLIPIRDTPVEPIPEPVNDNQKCERSTQQQFEYFQTYISQIQKQKKFDEEQQIKIDMFLFQQEMLKQKQDEAVAPSRGITLVMQKEDIKPKKKMLVKIKIKKKDKQSEQGIDQLSKIRVVQAQE